MIIIMRWHSGGRQLINWVIHFVRLLLDEQVNIHFGFYWGAQISDPENMLIGEGNQYRYLLVKSKTGFPKTYIKKLLKETFSNSVAKVKDKKKFRS